MDTKTRVLAAAAGAAALAGLAALAAALKEGRLSGLLPSGGRSTIRLAFDTHDWVVQIEGVEAAGARYGTKRDALRDARAFARDQAPSRLVVHRRDGSEQFHHEYDSDGNAGDSG